MADRRTLKVYNTNDKNYIATPTIILKGQWLRRYGFEMNMPISVMCDKGELIIKPRGPDTEPRGEIIESFISSLSKKRLKLLEKRLQENQYKHLNKEG